MTILEQKFLETIPSRLDQMVKEFNDLNSTLKSLMSFLREEIKTAKEEGEV